MLPLSCVYCLAVFGAMLVTRVTSNETAGTELPDPSLLDGVDQDYYGGVRGLCGSYMCRNGGTCSMMWGKPRCICKAGFIGNRCQDMKLELSCDGTGMRLQLLKSALEELSVNASSLHTPGHKCTLQDASPLHLAITLTHHNHSLCGTLVTANGTHLIYSGELTSSVLPLIPEHAISRSSDLLIRFSCVYQYDRVVSLPFPLRSSASLVTFVVKEGAFNVTMTLHPSADFLHLYDRPPLIPLTEKLYIQLQILGLASLFTLKLEECWATPESNPASRTRHPIISKGLGVDPTVEWFQDYDNQTLRRFALRMFHFVKFPEFFLHCRIWLCQPNITPDCQQQVTGNTQLAVLEDYREVHYCIDLGGLLGTWASSTERWCPVAPLE